MSADARSAAVVNIIIERLAKDARDAGSTHAKSTVGPCTLKRALKLIETKKHENRRGDANEGDECK